MLFDNISHIYCLYSIDNDKDLFQYKNTNVSYHKYDINSVFKNKSYFREALMYECIIDAYNNKYDNICFLYPDIKILENECNFRFYNIFCLNPFDVENNCLIINKTIIEYIYNLDICDCLDYTWKENLLSYLDSNFKIYYPEKNYVKHKVDYVITYVNNNDFNWIKQYNETFNNNITNISRFRDYGTLESLINGVRKYCSFIDDIYIIVSSYSQLNENILNMNIKVVEHKDIIPGEFLPAFNSCTIEMFLPKIKGLSEYFIYGNDDMFFVNYCNINNFYNKGKLVLELRDISNENSIYINQVKNSFKLTLSEFNFNYLKHIKMPKTIKQPVHTPHPLRKSSALHLLNYYENKIYDSISMTRDNNNMNQYMFIYYEYLMNNVCFDNILKYEYLLYNNIQNKGLKYDNNTQVICINDINNTIYNVNEICDHLANISNINKVALCAIGKNENLYIREWVEHYKNIGISKIFLYDNNDIDGEHFEDVINDYVKSGFVEIIDVRGIWPAQIDSYESFYHSDKSLEYSWILFCDIDEFLEFPDKYTSVSQFVSNKIFNDYDVIKICWKCYDDNDLVYVKDNDYSVKRFKKPAINQPYTNSQTKMFLRTNRDAHIISPHGALTKNGYNEHLKVCNTRGEQLKTNDIRYTNSDPMAYVHDNCWLNHYRFKTIEEYIIKTKRGWPTVYMDGGKQYMNARFFFLHNKYTREKHKLFAKLLNRDYISITTYGSVNQNKNWGDDINFSFIQELLDYKYECINANKNMNEDNYAFIGSILTDNYLTPSTIVWGAGIPDKDKIITIKPKKILAVRGPLTRKKLLEQGIKCPAVYGDPALLIHLVYNPQIEKKYKLGIIPHFSNLTNKKLNEVKRNPNVKIISLTTYKGCWKNVIDDILSCEYIISESLHGLIISESYKIPNLWINIEDTPNKNKGIFKYLDFYHSIGKTNIKNYIDISDYNDLQNIIETINNNWYYKFNINLNKLINACPFKIELKQLDKNINTNNKNV